jgi:hypothetical protein
MPFNRRYLPPVCLALGLFWFGPALWIAVAPHSFFDHVGPFGPYNSHFLGDAAAFQGGIGIALLAAAWLDQLRAGALTVALGAAGLHTINHWIDVNNANGGSSAGPADAILLTLLTLITIAPLRAALRKEADTCESSWRAHRAPSVSS